MFPIISRISYEYGACWSEERRQRGVGERRQSHGLTEDDRHEKKKVAPWCFPEFLEFPTNAERADAKRKTEEFVNQDNLMDLLKTSAMRRKK